MCFLILLRYCFCEHFFFQLQFPGAVWIAELSNSLRRRDVSMRILDFAWNAINKKLFQLETKPDPPKKQKKERKWTPRLFTTNHLSQLLFFRTMSKTINNLLCIVFCWFFSKLDSTLVQQILPLFTMSQHFVFSQPNDFKSLEADFLKFKQHGAPAFPLKNP